MPGLLQIHVAHGCLERVFGAVSFVVVDSTRSSVS